MAPFALMVRVAPAERVTCSSTFSRMSTSMAEPWQFIGTIFTPIRRPQSPKPGSSNRLEEARSRDPRNLQIDSAWFRPANARQFLFLGGVRPLLCGIPYTAQILRGPSESLDCPLL